MTDQEFNDFCGSHPATTYVMQWGGSHVWKVGGKVFAIGGWHQGEVGITFKTPALAFEILKDQSGLRPAPYLASRGLKWIQIHAVGALSTGDLRAYLRQSYFMVARGLPKRKQIELGLA